MAQTAADVLIETLLDWDVEVVFGLPGDGINGIMEALRTRQDRIRFVQVRHEESAAFMACGYAKFTGRLGVCLATSGPGGIHLLNGLYDAKLDGQPVLAITGLPYHDLVGTHTQQDVELDRVFMDVCKYNARVMGPSHVENVVDLACRTALTYHGVVHITIPVDVQEMKADKLRSKRNVPHHTSDVAARSARLPADGDRRRAAELLNAGGKVAILAGRGALGAGDELERVADLLAAPIVKALLGKAVVRDDSPYTTGAIGLLGTRPSQEALEACDTLLIVGTSFPYIEYYPKPGQARRRQLHSVSGNLASMACGLPYAIAAQLAYPDRQVIAFVGDGGLSMLMAKLATCVRYRLPVKVVVIKNNTLGQIKWEQMVFLGNPEYGCDLQPIDFAMVAEACGATGLTVDDPAQCGKVLDRALGTPGPVVVQAVVDPFEPPMPPKITLEQAAKFAQALVRGEPNREKIALTVLRDRVREAV